MLFKLVSDGRYTRVEIDGKMLGPGVTGVSFSHAMEGAEHHVTAHFDLDLTKGDIKRPVFEDAKTGEFGKILASFERGEKLLKQQEEAKDTIAWQIYRANDGTAGGETAQDIINQINERTERYKAISICPGCAANKDNDAEARERERE